MNFQLAQDEENELSKKDKEIQDEGKQFKERHVSTALVSPSASCGGPDADGVRLE